MTRLYDRLLTDGCAPLQLSRLGDFGAQLADRWLTEAEQLSRANGEAVTVDAIRQAISVSEPTAMDRFDLAHLRGAKVIVADEVADYINDLGDGGDLADLVTTVAPPFDRFFIEMHPRAGRLVGFAPLHAAGVLCSRAEFLDDHDKPVLIPLHETYRALTRGQSLPGAAAAAAEIPIRWLLSCLLILEPSKRAAYGPVGQAWYPLDESGRLIRLDDGHVVGFDSLPRFPDGWYEPAFFRALWDRLAPMLMPALFAISLMHCKNVELRTVDPPPALSKKHARKSGAPLTRYHVLEITPMRRILDSEGGARTRGMGQALHICRGHFKTYTPEAPLFGKHVGAYWWNDRAQGERRRGTVTTDYQISATPHLAMTGAPPADDSIGAAPTDEPGPAG